MLPESVLPLLPRQYRPAASARITLLTGGSDRSFYRVEDDGRRYVILHDTALEDEFLRYISVQKCLWDAEQGVPELYFADTAARLAVLEDLGDTSLEHITAGAAADTVEAVYRNVIDYLVTFQSAVRNPWDNAVLGDREFDMTMLRWETWYFRTYYLGELKRLPESRTQALLPEFIRLAERLNRAPRVLLHRDFQAQNVFITDGNIRIIDFQAVQPGPAGYDAVSLIRDPYADLPAGLSRELLWYYRQQSIKKYGIEITEEVLVAASLQRLLQALGAYGFLSSVKGKKVYLKYVPAALRQLHDVLEQCPGMYPVLEQHLAM